MDSLFVAFTTRLEQAGVPYMVTGSVASMIYGEPRLTLDVDLVIEIDEPHIDALCGAFPLEEFYCPPADVIRLESRRPRRGHFNIIQHSTGLRADVYTVGRDPLHHWAMSQRRSLAVEGNSLHVAPPEYVILRKLEYYREGQSQKHIDDIRGMLSHSSDEIDFAFVEQKVSDMDLHHEWSLARGA